MAKVLVIDDDHSLVRALRVGLQAGGHDVSSAHDGESGLTQVAMTSPDVVVLDLGLPDLDGVVVCQRVRQWSDVPIIILSALEADEQKIAALDSGANDYVTKPFSMGELEARIRAVLRAHAVDTPAEPSAISVGEFLVDFVHHELRRDGLRVGLTSKEFNLFAFLARYAGRTCTYEMILRSVWGLGYADEASYVHAYVHRLRQKLNDEAGSLIETVPGVGYVLREPR